MKTYEQNCKKYWCETVPMAEAAGIDPWLCVRCTGMVLNAHPRFNNLPKEYDFALTVLEKRPVFVGDRLYGKNLPITVLANEHFNLGDYTWTPPTKKRTFMLGGVEFESPVFTAPKNIDNQYVKIGEVLYGFPNSTEARKFESHLHSILKAAIHKE